MPKSGPHQEPNAAVYTFTCVMCGFVERAARPDALTCSGRCRNALRRWRKKFGSDPTEPPGCKNWHNTAVGREALRKKYKLRGNQ